MYLKTLEEYEFGEIIQDEYVYLIKRGIVGSSDYIVPNIGEIIQETLYTASWNYQETQVKEAIMRNEHDIYGLDKRDFVKLARAGDLRGFEMRTVSAMDVQDQVIGYLRTRHISFTDYTGDVLNSPIGRGIW